MPSSGAAADAPVCNAMRTAIFFVVLLAALVNPTLNAQDTRQQAPLRLTLKVTDSQYCVADDEVDGLNLKLRFSFENRTNGPIILYKMRPFPTRFMVARNLSDAAAQQYELDYSTTWYMDKAGDEADRCYKGASPTDCFTTIAPGSSYEADGEARVLAVRGDANDVPGAVKSGQHVLQLVVQTWDESGKVAQETASRWHSHGSLWYRPLTSEPLTFTIEKERTVVECK